MKQIQLTQQGDFLLPHLSRADEEGGELHTCIGSHKFCEGWIDIIQVTNTHRVIHCRRCNLRVLLPIEVDTWEKLETHMKCNLY